MNPQIAKVLGNRIVSRGIISKRNMEIAHT